MESRQQQSTEDGTPPATEQAPLGTFHALRYRNFRLLWVGNLFTAVANWIQMTTLGWVVYDRTNSGSILGGVSAVRIVPLLLLAPLAGLASDRFSRNTVIAVSQVALFLVTISIALALWSGQIEVWHFFAFAVLTAAANTFNQPARQVLVFDVVPRPVLPNAVALSNMAVSSSRAVSPMIGGALIVAFGAANNFLIQSLAYLAVMATVLRIRLPPRESGPPRKRAIFGDMAEGYRFAFNDPHARLLLLMSTINPLFLIPLHLALLPIFAKTTFAGDASSLGLMLGAIGVGGVFGGLLTASLNRVDRRGLLQLTALFVYSASQGAFSIVGAATGSMILAVPFLVLAGAAEALFNTTNQTVLQLVAPDHLRGRVVSVLQVSPLLIPVGALIGGTLADIMDAAIVGMLLSGLAFGIGLAILAFSPRMRNLRLSQLVAR